MWPGVVTASMRPAVAGDDLAVGERVVGPEVGVAAGVEPWPLADIERTRAAVRSFGKTGAPVAALMRAAAGE